MCAKVIPKGTQNPLGLRVGGNIGLSLLPQVDEFGEDDWVILELSSFQLDDLASLARRPAISVITNLSENHIDWHGSYDNYLEAKREEWDSYQTQITQWELPAKET